MNPRYYHTPLADASKRPRCPVCHEAVYSKAGIHPQCAVRQSEPPKSNAKNAAAAAVVAEAAEDHPPDATLLSAD